MQGTVHNGPSYQWIAETETVEWRSADADYGPRAARSAHTGPYEAAIPPRIADAPVHLCSPTVALVVEASAEIARFDGETHPASSSPTSPRPVPRGATRSERAAGAAAWALADLVTTRPVVDARLAAEKLGVSTVNAQRAIDRLVEDGVLEQVGNGTRDQVWQASEVLIAMDRFAERSHRRVW